MNSKVYKNTKRRLNIIQHKIGMSLDIDIGPELLNVSIRRIRLNSRSLLNKKNRRKFNL